MRFRTAIPAGSLLILAFAGCALPPIEAQWPDKRPLGADLSQYAPRLYEKPLVVSLSTAAEEPMGVITLREALALALLHNPHLAIYSWEVRQGEARTLQAGLLPNPEIESEFENFGGSNEFDGSMSLESTILLSQLIELGGKRAKRTRLAALDRDLAGWDYEAQRIRVLTNVAGAFVDVVAAQEELALSNELVILAETFLNTVSERVNAGKVSPIEETRAKVELSRNQIELDRSLRTLTSARKLLSATWGSSTALFERAEGDLYGLTGIPSVEELGALLEQNPDLARWSMEMAQRSAALDLELANRIPDVTLSGGVRRFNETNDTALVVGFSIPIPLFNRNQGSILEAKYGLAKAQEEQRAAEIEVRSAMTEAYRALSTSHSESLVLRDSVLPGAQSAFDAASEAYREGKFGYLEVLDAQRTLFGIRDQYVEALAAYHRAVAAVEGLIGAPLSETSIGG